jgi:hypothetical protein
MHCRWRARSGGSRETVASLGELLRRPYLDATALEQTSATEFFMRRSCPAIPAITLFGVAVAEPAFGSCGNSNGTAADAGPDAVVDTSFVDTSMPDTSMPDAGKVETGPQDAPSDGAMVLGISAGSTGAFGVVTANGKQKMYLPQTVTLDDAVCPPRRRPGHSERVERLRTRRPHDADRRSGHPGAA